jgi:D-sedoheptulose 7-phosphate isomerase
MISEHLDALHCALDAVEGYASRIDAWGHRLAATLTSGGRLLAVGNGGSAAQAQHLTAELVGRYQAERPPLSAIALHAETSTVTALLNDYPPEQLFARQVRAHGRHGDVLLALSTSGRSANVLAAVREAGACGLTRWAITGAGPNPVSMAADECVCVESKNTATIQEVHQVIVHLICEAVDAALAAQLELVATGGSTR